MIYLLSEGIGQYLIEKYEGETCTYVVSNIDFIEYGIDEILFTPSKYLCYNKLYSWVEDIEDNSTIKSEYTFYSIDFNETTRKFTPYILVSHNGFIKFTKKRFINPPYNKTHITTDLEQHNLMLNTLIKGGYTYEQLNAKNSY